MEILIGEKYRISTDIRSIQLDELVTGKEGKSEGVARWKPMGWYGDWRQALNALAVKHLGKSEARSIKELQSVIDAFLKDVNAANVLNKVSISAPTDEFLA